jgi:MFS family permease
VTTAHLAAARRITRTLFAAQSISSAGGVAIFPTFPILGAQLSGSAAMAGIPGTISLLGQALSAYVWGYAMDRLGRRGSLILGMGVGVVASLLAGLGAIAQSFPLFLLGAGLAGVANSALNLSRFVAAEVHAPDRRARAISTVVLGGTVGAVFGPAIVKTGQMIADRARVEELAGPFALSVALFALTALVLFIWLRPEPRDLGRLLTEAAPDPAVPTDPTRGVWEILRAPAAMVAVTAMVFGQLVMAMLMVITALHMRNHEHTLTSISFVISGHVVGMYAFSIVSGRLADIWGRRQVIITGAAVLILAALTAPLSPHVLPLAVSLFLLGLGWNFCYVAGSTLLSDQLSPAERGRTQGFNDLLIGAASAMGTLGSGIVFAAVGFGAMGLVGAVAALVPLSMAAIWRSGRPA